MIQLRRYLPLLVIVLLITSPVAAQDCGAGLPCGPIPWGLPLLPDLSSPTPFPTVVVTSGSTVTPTPGPTSTGTITATPTVTPTPTATSLVDMDTINDSFGTLQSVVEATQETIFDRSTGFDLPGNASNIFGYLLGLQTIHFGVFTPMIQFIFFGFFLIVGVKLLFFLMPVFLVIIGFVRKVLSTIMEFIPG